MFIVAVDYFTLQCTLGLNKIQLLFYNQHYKHY